MNYRTDFSQVTVDSQISIADLYLRGLMPKFIKANEVAKLLGRTPQAIYWQVSKGVYPPHVAARVGSTIIFDEAALLAWIAKGGSFAKSEEEVREEVQSEESPVAA
jgi:predicted DNA-binding transcriptional regulator AlpA